jgi:hypothetical protein
MEQAVSGAVVLSIETASMAIWVPIACLKQNKKISIDDVTITSLADDDATSEMFQT